MNRFADAEAVYNEAAAILRELAAKNAIVYAPNLSGTFNNLGGLYWNTHRTAEAEGTLKEDADIRRDLAAQSPAVYWDDLVMTLANLYSIYHKAHRESDANAVKAELLDAAHKIGSPPQNGKRNAAAIINGRP
jgi:hypothetical protein